MRHRLLAALAVSALLLAACGGDDPTVDATDDAPDTAATGTTPADTPSPAATEQETAGETDGVEVGTASTDLGPILVDGDGMTLYLFDNDSEGESACYDSCAETWPPLVGGEATATGDADPSLLGTVERDDGSVQVTYAGHPLYLYAADSAPGDVDGQGVGGVWWVVSPEGERITDDASAGGGPDY